MWSICVDNVAGWSSMVARQAHNLKVIGSNPIPASTLEEAVSKEMAFIVISARNWGAYVWLFYCPNR